MNKVILVGRPTRDPEVRYSQGAEGQMAIAKCILAVDRRFKREGDQQSADFIPLTAFGRQGEFFEKYVHQGTKLIVEGRIQTGSYTNNDGQRVYTTDVVVENTEFAESKASGGNNASSQPAAAPQQSMSDGFMNIPDGIEDSGLPFN